ncbi:MAG: nitroreductase family protein [Deltaproteobacteria bacterium]|nr:nitroreductase family protein [Deltaproteobacteria bacterium]
MVIEINRELCNGCKLCVKICPPGVLAVIDGKASLKEDCSLKCGHCEAICPMDAVRVYDPDTKALKLSTMKDKDEWLDYGNFDKESLVQLMRSRRSCRTFTGNSVDRDVLEDLVKIGITAPSGSNSQRWTFTILDNRPSVIELAEGVARFMNHLNRMSERMFLRLFSKIFMRDALGKYYRGYYKMVRASLQQWEENHIDRLFFGAPAVILVGMKPGASCPCEDALLASQNILLAAHAMGLGTCLIGIAVEAIKRDPAIKKIIGIPIEERVYAVIAIGVPGEKFARQAGRKNPIIRYGKGS